MTVEIHRAHPDDWQLVRTVRLAALADAPYAFGSTYDREIAFGESEWRQRLAGQSVTFLAYLPEHGDRPIGISGGFPEDEETVELVSMWVDPAARGTGAAELLVEKVVDWARLHGALRVHLLVTESGKPARRLYERTGFIYTDEREALPWSATVFGLGMVRPCE